MKKNYPYLKVTESFFTHNLNTVYQIMTLFVYKIIRQAKLSCIYSISEDVGLYKPFFYYYFPLVSTKVIALHYNTTFLREGKNIQIVAANSRPHGC